MIIRVVPIKAGCHHSTRLANGLVFGTFGTLVLQKPDKKASNPPFLCPSFSGDALLSVGRVGASKLE